MTKKNLAKREGWKNRHAERLPNQKEVINITVKDIDGEHNFLCDWDPFDKGRYNDKNMPSQGYLGTATVIDGKSKGIGFHAWEQNNSEFVYWNVGQTP